VVKDFATWNEANYFGEPTASSPQRVAGYYSRCVAIARRARSSPPSCSTSAIARRRSTRSPGPRVRALCAARAGVLGTAQLRQREPAFDDVGTSTPRRGHRLHLAHGDRGIVRFPTTDCPAFRSRRTMRRRSTASCSTSSRRSARGSSASTSTNGAHCASTAPGLGCDRRRQPSRPAYNVLANTLDSWASRRTARSPRSAGLRLLPTQPVTRRRGLATTALCLALAACGASARTTPTSGSHARPHPPGRSAPECEAACTSRPRDRHRRQQHRVPDDRRFLALRIGYVRDEIA